MYVRRAKHPVFLQHAGSDVGVVHSNLNLIAEAELVMGRTLALVPAFENGEQGIEVGGYEQGI